MVCSVCQGLGVGFVNRRLLGELVYQLEYYLWVQLASQSFLVGPQLYCCAKSLFSPPLYSLPPLFLSMG